jgi:hypothetical protein
MTDRLLSASTSLPGRVTRVPPKVSYHGDSIAWQMGILSCSSPSFWQQCFFPRDYRIVRDGANQPSFDSGSAGASLEYGGNFAVSSTYSGAIWTGAGRTGTQLRACGTNDMTDAARLARVAIYAPDIMFIEVATNENVSTYTTAAIDATILNVKDLIAANPNPAKQIVICNVYPRNGPMYDHVRNYVAWARRMARLYPSYHFLDLASFCVDDSDATNYKWQSGLSPDNLHPGPVASRVTYVELDRLWTKLGVRRKQPRPCFQQDAYSATNLGGNLLGTRGVMAGTATAISAVAGVAGNKPSSWTGGTGPIAVVGDSTNILITYALGTLTDDRGAVHTAVVLTITNTGTPLTTNTTHTVKLTAASTPANFTGFLTTSQAIVQHTSLVGMSNISLNINADAGASGNTVAMGGTGASGAVMPTVGSAETLYMVNPWEMNSAGTAVESMSITMAWASGALPTGTIAIAACGIWMDLPSAYD